MYTRQPCRSAILAALWLLACQDSATSDRPAHDHAYVEAGFLRAPDGRALILRGANVSGEQKWAPYLDAHGAADYLKLRTVFGMNSMRFVMTWAAVEPTPGHYDDAYLDAVATRLGWAQDAGLLVVLDMHQDVFGEGFGFDGAPRWACEEARYRAFMPREPWFINSLDPNVQACVDKFFTDAPTQARFIAAWQHVAARLAAAPAVIGFDVLNEPNWGTYALADFEHDRLAPLYTQVVVAVRGAAPHWVAFEPAATRNLGLATGLTAFPFADVVYAPHSYDNNAESGSGFDPTHRATVLENFAALSEEATALHAALWVGEYGGVTNSAGYADYMRAEYDGAGAVAASTIYWDYSRGGGYSMLNKDGTPRSEVLEALVRPYPERVAGTPRSYDFDAPSGRFRFLYRSAASSDPSQTTELIPERLFPSGYRVECGGCSTQKEADRLRIMDVPPDAELEIIISR